MPSRPSTTKPYRRSGPAGNRRRPGINPLKRLWKLTSSSVQDTDRLGRAIGRGLRGGETIALVGALGAGKTALVRSMAKGLGAAPASVSSPTFVLIHEYRGRLPLTHVDLYRIGSVGELESTGLADYLSGCNVTVIEWADNGRSWLPDDLLEIELRHLAVESRTIRLTAGGPVSSALLSRTHIEFHRESAFSRSRQQNSHKASRA